MADEVPPTVFGVEPRQVSCHIGGFSVTRVFLPSWRVRHSQASWSVGQPATRPAESDKSVNIVGLVDFLAHAGEPLLAGSLKRLLILARLGWGEILAEAKYAGAGYIVVAVTQDAALESLKLLVSVLSTTGVWIALDGGTTVY